MIVSKILLDNWMSLVGTAEVTLPPRGYVLITGQNGQGKSSLREAIAFARSGKTLRGETPWRERVTGAVRVEGLDGRGEPIVVERGIEKGSKTWVRIDGAEQATPTKGTEAIAQRLGEWKTWIESSVLTGDQLSAFADASDKQRKELLESFIGVGGYDAALKLARGDRKILDVKLEAKQSELARLENELDQIEADVATLSSDSESSKESPTKKAADLSAEIEDVQAEIDDCEKELADVDRRLPLLRKTIAELREQVQDLNVRSNHFQSRIQANGTRQAQLKIGSCPVCESLLESEKVDALKSTIREENEEFEAESKLLLDEAAKVRARLEKILATESGLVAEKDRWNQRIRKLSDEIGELKADRAEAKAEEKNVAEEVAALKRQFAEKDEEATQVSAELERLTRKILVNQWAQAALIPKGIRAIVLSSSLVALERATNRRLARLFPGARVRILPSRTLEDGRVVDEIDVQITGVADDHGYKALSTGQRKRIDFALLLGLAAMARGASGPSTLWFDEVLDGLDDAGVEAVCDLVRDIAEEVPVVVISHREELVERLSRGAQEWWNVTEGRPVGRSARTESDEPTKRATEGDGDGERIQAKQSNGTARRGRKARAPAAEPTAADAAPPRKGRTSRAGSRRSAGAR